MNNIVEIKVDKSITGLAGYNYGKKIYTEQVKNKIDLKQNFVIVFPNNVQRMASSFIQGFFEEIIGEIGILGIERQLEIKSSNSDLKKIIVKNLI